jgi:hypothetical protein
MELESARLGLSFQAEKPLRSGESFLDTPPRPAGGGGASATGPRPPPPPPPPAPGWCVTRPDQTVKGDLSGC